MIYWFTGQPGAGKTTLCNYLKIHLHNKNVFHIDGDDIRDIYDNKDYSEVGRRKNIELAQNIAHFIHNKGGIALVSLVSPYRNQREQFKSKFGKDIKEIYVHTSDNRGKEQFHVQNYESPTENYLDLNTSGISEMHSYRDLIKQLGL